MADGSLFPGRYAWPAQNLEFRPEPKAVGSHRGHDATFIELERNGGDVRHRDNSRARSLETTFELVSFRLWHRIG